MIVHLIHTTHVNPVKGILYVYVVAYLLYVKVSLVFTFHSNEKLNLW